MLRPIKASVKSLIVGPPGLRERRIRAGLLRGLRFRVDTARKSLRLIGFDERELTDHVRRLVRGCATAVDVGANDGWYAVYFAAQPNIQRVYAVEPESEFAAEITANFAANGIVLANKLQYVPKFLSAPGDSVLRRSVGAERVTSVDELIRNDPTPVLLKVDVDGGEVDVLKGAENLLAAHDGVCVIETHSAELEAHCISLLDGFGLKTQIVRNGWYRPLMPERRVSKHCRWLLAWPPGYISPPQ